MAWQAKTLAVSAEDLHAEENLLLHVVLSSLCILLGMQHGYTHRAHTNNDNLGSGEGQKTTPGTDLWLSNTNSQMYGPTQIHTQKL